MDYDGPYKYVTIRYEVAIPVPTSGVLVSDFYAAMGAMEELYRERRGEEPTADDWLRMSLNDQYILLYFDVESHQRYYPSERIPEELA